MLKAKKLETAYRGKNMKSHRMAVLIIMIAIFVAFPSISSVEGKDLTQSDYEEYILSFVGAASYQLPEPPSMLSSLIMSSPNLTMGALRNWAYNNMLSTTRNPMDAGQSGNKEQIDYYNDRLDRWQAVYSCLNGDCGHMQQLEGSPGTEQAGIE